MALMGGVVKKLCTYLSTYIGTYTYMSIIYFKGKKGNGLPLLSINDPTYWENLNFYPKFTVKIQDQ